jgi:hypothetical protein
MIDTIQEWMIAAQKLICEGYFIIKENKRAWTGRIARACTSCKSLRQPEFYSLTWAYKYAF